MNNTEFKKVVHGVLTPLGFRRDGNYWHLLKEDIEKIIYIQKSSFSNSYYLNYGFNLLNLDLDSVTMHIYNRLGSSDLKRQKLIDDTFDLESDIKPEVRITNIINILNDHLIKLLSEINCEDDIRELLRKRSQINDIPIAVKKHLKL